MSKDIRHINIIILIKKIFISRVIWRININYINLSFVSFFQKFESSEIVTFNQEIHFATIVNEEIFVFGQNWHVSFQFFVNFLTVLLEHETVFFAFHIFG